MRFVLLGALCLSGCTALLDANFEADTVGALPNASPAGPPATDAIDVQPGAGSEISVTGDALQGNRSLRIEAAPNSSARAFFRASGPGTSSLPVVIDMAGRLTPGSHAEVNVWTGSPFFAVQISMQNGQIVANGINAGSYLEGGAHRMILTLFPSTDTFSLTYSGQVVVGNGISGPLNRPTSYPGARLGVAVETLATGQGSVYIVDDVTISSRSF